MVARRAASQDPDGTDLNKPVSPGEEVKEDFDDMVGLDGTGNIEFPAEFGGGFNNRWKPGQAVDPQAMSEEDMISAAIAASLGEM